MKTCIVCIPKKQGKIRFFYQSFAQVGKGSTHRAGGFIHKQYPSAIERAMEDRQASRTTLEKNSFFMHAHLKWQKRKK